MDEVDEIVLKAKRAEANSMMGKIEQTLCKNAKLNLEEETDLHKNINILAVNTGCKGERRNGSAFCAECSEELKDLTDLKG